MSCGCDNLKMAMERSRMRGLAKRAAQLDGCTYVLYVQNGVYGFAREGEPYKGKVVEKVVV